MNTALALAPKGQWSRTGLDLPDAMSFDDWLDVGDRLQAAEASVKWWIGDWLIFGERVFAGKFAQAAEKTGYSVEVLKDAKRVASAFPPEERAPGLTWSVHRAAVTLPREERSKVILRAESESWTCRDMRAEVARLAVGIRRGEGHQILPLPEVAEKIIKRTGKVIHAAFCDWFGVGDEYGRVLLCLYQSGGRPCDWRDIAKFVSTHQPMTRGATQEAIHTLRDSMESESIDRSDDGYWLTEIGFAECRSAFRDLGGQLMGMGSEPAND